jgi:hypothetical protein
VEPAGDLEQQRVGPDRMREDAGGEVRPAGEPDADDRRPAGDRGRGEIDQRRRGRPARLRAGLDRLGHDQAADGDAVPPAVADPDEGEFGAAAGQPGSLAIAARRARGSRGREHTAAGSGAAAS